MPDGTQQATSPVFKVYSSPHIFQWHTEHHGFISTRVKEEADVVDSKEEATLMHHYPNAKICLSFTAMIRPDSEFHYATLYFVECLPMTLYYRNCIFNALRPKPGEPLNEWLANQIYWSLTGVFGEKNWGSWVDGDGKEMIKNRYGWGIKSYDFRPSKAVIRMPK